MEVFLHPDDADGDEKSLYFRYWNHCRCFQFTDFSYWVLYVTFDVIRQDSAFGCAAFSRRSSDQRRDGRTKWPQSTAAGARGDGKGRQVSCLPSSRWPPGRRGCGTRRRCDRASLRTRLRSRRKFRIPLSRSNPSPRTRGLLARRRRAAGPDSGAAGGGLAAHLESPLPRPERSHPPSLPFPTRPGRPPRRRTGAWRRLRC